MGGLLSEGLPTGDFEEKGGHVPYRQKERRNMSDLYLQILLLYLLWLNG